MASVLDLDASDVPHFVQYIEHPAGTDSHLWWWALVGFCSAHGWRVDYHANDGNTPVPKGWALADGKSQRGHAHVVVCHDGKLIHDPHPSDACLVRINGWFTLERRIDGSADGADLMTAHDVAVRVVAGEMRADNHFAENDAREILAALAGSDEFRAALVGVLGGSVPCRVYPEDSQCGDGGNLSDHDWPMHPQCLSAALLSALAPPEPA